jgi:hypothetical protein
MYSTNNEGGCGTCAASFRHSVTRVKQRQAREHRSPTIEAKETYYRGKRDLLQPETISDNLGYRQRLCSTSAS